MHYMALVALPPDTEPGALDDALASMLAPYGESYEHDCPRDESNDWDAPCEACDRTWWDWWQVGGRWTGWLSGYEPGADPANWERCELCNGTGKRRDWLGAQAAHENPDYGCNGCSISLANPYEHNPAGPGRRVAWSFRPHPGDILTVDQWRALTCDKRPFRIVTGEGVHSRTEVWNHPQFEANGGWPHKGGNRTAYDAMTAELDDAWEIECNRVMGALDPRTILVIVDYHS